MAMSLAFKADRRRDRGDAKRNMGVSGIFLADIHQDVRRRITGVSIEPKHLYDGHRDAVSHRGGRPSPADHPRVAGRAGRITGPMDHRRDYRPWRSSR